MILMSRSEPNWIAMGCGIAFVLSFLFLPFYNVVMVPVNGWSLLQYVSAVMFLPLAAGIAMAVAPLILHPKISIGIAAGTLLLVFILLLTGRSVLVSGNALTMLASNWITQAVGMDVTTILYVTSGIGCILCMLLCVGHIVAELLVNRRRRPIKNEEDKDLNF
jgi:hypothetical protein